MSRLKTRYVGLELSSPIVVASAGITETVERMQKAQECGAGAVVMKSLFEKEICRVAPTPRFRILKHNLGKERTFTFMSYEQASEWGPQRYAEEVARAKAELDIRVIPSINCVTEEGWLSYAKMMEEAGADALELNVSCPHSSITFSGEDVENRIYQVVRLVRESVSLPIIPKLSPMLTNPLRVAKRLEEIGANGVTIFNRMTGLDIDIEDQVPTMPGGYAGHGGPWAVQYPLRWISAIRPQVEMDIAASGGVTGWEDVVKYLLAGATVVQVCTAVILNGYRIIEELCRGVEDYMIRKGYRSLNQFRGKVCSRILTTEEIPREHTLVARIDPEPTAPCQVACPVAVPIQAFVRLIAEREFEEAWRQVKSKDPLQRILSSVCPGFCEQECTHTLLDRSVSIMALKRFILDWGRKRGLIFQYQKAAEMSGKKVAVIGSGPAGLTAAFDLARAGHQVTIFEAQPVAGGMLSLGIPEFRLPRDLVRQEIAEIEEMGVEICLSRPIRSLDELTDYDAVFLGIGALRNRDLGVPGEDAQGVSYGLDFLRRLNQGEPVRVGERVVVVGGGNTAVDAARAAIRLGAKEVFLAYRRTKDEMPADLREVHEAEAEGVKILFLVVPNQIITEGGSAVALRCSNLYLAASDQSGRRRPQVVEGTEFHLAADTIILALGQSVDLTIDSLETTAQGTIKTDEMGRTNKEGIFAGGDAVLGPATVAEAVASGRKAAVAIDRYLRGEGNAFLQPESPMKAVDKWAVWRRNSHIEMEKEPRTIPQILNEEQAVMEARRCLACGCGVGCDLCHQICIYSAVEKVGSKYRINSEKCDGCGLCVQRCPNQTISMVPRPVQG